MVSVVITPSSPQHFVSMFVSFRQHFCVFVSISSAFRQHFCAIISVNPPVKKYLPIQLSSPSVSKRYLLSSRRHHVKISSAFLCRFVSISVYSSAFLCDNGFKSAREEVVAHPVVVAVRLEVVSVVITPSSRQHADIITSSC